MATTFQHRRGSTSSHGTFTGASGEITVNTSKNVAVVHDGSTSGGFEMLRSDLNNINISGTSANNALIKSDGDGTYSFTSWTTTTPIGVAQSWTNQTSSRSLSTTYTNTTGAPIQVNVYGFGPNISNYFFNLFIDSLTVATSGINQVNGGQNQCFVTGIVPNGDTYRVTASGPSVAINGWYELR